MEKNNLDQFLREQVEAADLPMQEAHWLKAVAMLDAVEDEKQKKPFGFWRGLSILIGLLFVGACAYLLPKMGNKTKQNVATNNALKIENKNNTNGTAIITTTEPTEIINKEENKRNGFAKIENTNTTNEAKQTNELNESINNNNYQANAEPTISTSISTTETKAQKVNADKIKPKGAKINWFASKDSEAKAKRNSPEITEPKNTTVAINNENSRKQNKVASDNEMVNLDLSKQENPNESSIEKKEISVNTSKTKQKSINIKQTTLLKTKKEISKRVDAKNTTKQKNNTNPYSKNVKDNLPENEIAKLERLANNTNTPKTIEELNIEQINKARAAKNQALIATKDNNYYRDPNRDETIYNPRYLPNAKKVLRAKEVNVDTVANAVSIVTPTIKNFNPIVNNLWWFVASGVFLNQGFKGNADTAINVGLAPYITTGIEKELNSRLTICTQIGLTYFNALNTKKEQTNYRYSFGYDSTNFKIEYKKLMQLYLPVTAYWQFAKKHFLMGGVGINYTFNTQSKVQTNPIATATQEFGYMQGFKTLDAFATLGYAYKPNNRITFEASVQQGFNDITDNTFFNNTLNNKIFRANIGVRYNIKNLKKSR